MKILIVEDEKKLAKGIEKIFKKQGYVVDVVHNGLDAIDYVEEVEYDAIILDMMLPKMNGLDVLKALRKDGNSVPVLFLTAKSELGDKLAGFDVGADDYLTKPFETKELLARITAISRRKGEYISKQISFSDLTIDRDNLTFCVNKETMKVNTKEYLIMELFIVNNNKIISREKIVENIWGHDYEGEYNQVEVYISFIRKKLKTLKSKVKIKSTRGIGYSIGEGDD